jgi:hypothetical protein
LERACCFIVIEGIDKAQPLIKELLRLSVRRADRMMQVANAADECGRFGGWGGMVGKTTRVTIVGSHLMEALDLWSSLPSGDLKATRVGNGEIMFVTHDGRVVRTREPTQHGEGNGLGPSVAVRYDPKDPQHVIVDANTIGRDITLGIVAIKLLVGGLVFAALGARRLRRRAATDAR